MRNNKNVIIMPDRSGPGLTETASDSVVQQGAVGKYATVGQRRNLFSKLRTMRSVDDIALNLSLRKLNLHSHDLRVPVCSLSRFKLSLPQCNVPGVLNCMSGRLSGCPSLY